MYNLRLDLPISSQVLETLVIISVFDFFMHLRSCMKTVAVQAESKGGRVRAGTVPLLGQVVTVLHALAFHALPMVYVGALVLNKLQQPKWASQFALPNEIVGIRVGPVSQSALRVGACVAGLAPRRVIDAAFHHLGAQWHSLGRRERPRVVRTGPYAWVRHPLYSTILVQEMLWGVMFWSYIPFVALGIVAAALMVKMHIEEAMIQRDEGFKEEYREYMDEVRAKVIPCVW